MVKVLLRRIDIVNITYMVEFLFMGTLVTILQVASGIITLLLILIHEPKSEGLGSIGGSAGSFSGVRTSADEKLDKLTWMAAGTFLVCSAILGMGFVS